MPGGHVPGTKKTKNFDKRQIKFIFENKRIMGKQISLYDTIGSEESWVKEWQDMPEYSTENLEPKFQILISFRTEDDYRKFGKLIEQKITYKTKSIWYPEAKQIEVEHLRWVVEDEK